MDDYYDQIAPSYNELHGDEQRKKLDVIAEYIDQNSIKIDSSTKILDVGCGTGIVQDFFERTYKADTFGIDPSEKLLERNDYQCMMMKAEEMDFEDGEFDIVVSLTAIQNFEDIELGLREIKRVGKDLFILTYLKQSEKAAIIEGKIKSIFHVLAKIEEDKDIIFFAK
jgi:demethylmenaquinone methyltransferase/2-methoxy-6-polyprenyl-1,4-benzoquinol methylase